MEGLKGFVKELERAFNLFEEVNSTDGLQYNVHLCDLNQGLGSAGAAFPCVGVCVCLCLCVCACVCVCDPYDRMVLAPACGNFHHQVAKWRHASLNHITI